MKLNFRQAKFFELVLRTLKMNLKNELQKMFFFSTSSDFFLTECLTNCSYFANKVFITFGRKLGSHNRKFINYCRKNILRIKLPPRAELIKS